MNPSGKSCYVLFPMARDFSKLSQWIKFRPSLCQGCQAECCRLPVEATLGDLKRLGLASEDESGGKKLARRLISAGYVHHYRASTEIYTLQQRPTGDCIFLGKSTRKCEVYDLRPDVCRRFPEIGPRPGYCPAWHK